MTAILMLVRVYAGWLERDDAHLIPDELRPEFNVAVDAQGANEDEWSDLRLMYSRAARHYDFSGISGYNGDLSHVVRISNNVWDIRFGTGS